MKNVTRCVVASFCFALVAGLSPAAESPSVLLQKAIYAEETEGNLDSAIKLYEQIAAEAAANRSVVAQAQYRLAVCYQKKGEKPQAIKLLNELVQRSADQAVNKQARDALVALGEPPALALSIRRVSLPFAIGWVWDFSLDGRYVTYESQAPTEDIYVGDLVTGKSSLVFHGVKDKETPWTNALISPNSRRVAFDVGNQEGCTGVYVANLDGSESRRLYTNVPKTDSLWILGWAPDGNRVFAYQKPRAPSEAAASLVAIDVRTGDKTEIVRPPGQGSNREGWVLSPDGRLLARRKDNYPRTITVLNLASQHEETVADRNVGQIVGWLPDSKRLVFSKTDTDGGELWAANLDDGKPIAPAKKIWSDLAASRRPFVGSDGNLYFYTRNVKPDSYELWVMEGVLSGNPPPTSRTNLTQIPPEQILAPNHSVLDQNRRISFRYPAKWEVMDAGERADGLRTISFSVPNISRMNPPRITYSPTFAAPIAAAIGPRPKTTAELEPWLRKAAQFLVERKVNGGPPFGNYRVRSTGYIAGTINGHPAIGWSADFEKADKSKWVDFVTLVSSDTMVAMFDFNAIEPDVAAIRPGFDEMIATVRLP